MLWNRESSRDRRRRQLFTSLYPTFAVALSRPVLDPLGCFLTYTTSEKLDWLLKQPSDALDGGATDSLALLPPAPLDVPLVRKLKRQHSRPGRAQGPLLERQRLQAPRSAEPPSPRLRHPALLLQTLPADRERPLHACELIQCMGGRGADSCSRMFFGRKA